VYRALKGEVAARGLAKLEARVCTSSCLDQCETGVTVLVEPDHFFYGRVTVADVPEIVDGLVNGFLAASGDSYASSELPSGHLVRVGSDWSAANRGSSKLLENSRARVIR
jgi:(2Fe-2S) ferredoxin